MDNVNPQPAQFKLSVRLIGIGFFLMLFTGGLGFYFGVRSAITRTTIIPTPTLIPDVLSPIPTQPAQSITPTNQENTTNQAKYYATQEQCESVTGKVCIMHKYDCIWSQDNPNCGKLLWQPTTTQTSSANQNVCQTVADCYPGPTCSPQTIKMYGNNSHCPTPSCEAGVCYWKAVP